MNGPDRYRTLSGRPIEAGDGVLEGVDPVTGLPVLIYDFDGTPLASPGELDSPNIPTILWSGEQGGGGRLVAALSSGWQRLHEGSGPLTPGQLLDAGRALRDAAAAGVVHGDIAPWRLLLVEGRLQVEGYGVPWRPRASRYRAPEAENEATVAADVYSLAKSVEVLGVSVEDETLSAVLQQCLADDPLARPNAEELYLALEALVEVQEVGKGAAPGLERAESPPATAGAAASDTAEQSDEAAGASDEMRRRPPPPPSSAEEPRERRIRLTLLGALMAAVVLLALLALYGPRGSEPEPPEPLEDIVYVVDVEVVPDDLPPVTIHLVRAPDGSSLARSESIGTAPRHLALDRAGTWAFQGSLQGRRSEVVEIAVPEERTVTLVMPPADAR